MKKLYSDKPCPTHKSHGEIAATCKRCYTLALGQQRRQWEKQREIAHEQYLAQQQMFLEAA